MELWSVTQVASEMGVSRRRVLALIEAARLPARKVGSQYVIDPADVGRVRRRKPGRPRKAGRGGR